MNVPSIRHMSDQLGILIRGLGVGPLTGDVVDGFAVLPLVSRDHVDGLLEQVKIKILITERWREVEISIYESLRPGIKERVNIALIPTSLFYGLEFAIEVIKPLANVALVRL